MADLDSSAEPLSPPTPSDHGLDGLLNELARATPALNALAQVALPPELRALVGSVPQAADEVPKPGALIAGRYRLESVIGAGGMGVVFAARHLQTGRAVALKWMVLTQLHRTPSERSRALQRFAREALAAGRIRHANVVDVYDASSDEAAPYLVMELLQGETLRARITRGPLSWDELIQLLVPALHGVAELHRQGIVHRDLKPDNVFLARVEGGDTLCAKVLDFGVSLLLSKDDAEDSLTGTGALLGTPAYMPLEQLRGDGTVDERTDVYALGVVLFEALTGQRPWRARNAGEYGALLASARPTRLSSLRADLKGAREAAIMKALQRDPGQRHASVTAFIAALEAATLRASASKRWALPVLALGLTLMVLRALTIFGTSTVRPHPPAGESQSWEVIPTNAPARSEVKATVPELSAPVQEPVEAPPAPVPAATRKAKRASTLTKAQRLDALPAQQRSPTSTKDFATELTRDDF